MSKSKRWSWPVVAMIAFAASCGDAVAPTEAEHDDTRAAYAVAGRQGESVRVYLCAPPAAAIPAALLVELEWNPEVARFADGLEVAEGGIVRADASHPGRVRIAAVMAEAAPVPGASCVGSFLIELTGAPGASSEIRFEIVQAVGSVEGEPAEFVLTAPVAIQILR